MEFFRTVVDELHKLYNVLYAIAEQIVQKAIEEIKLKFMTITHQTLLALAAKLAETYGM